MVAVPNDATFKVVTGIHRTIFDVTKGRLLGRAMGMPVVKLTTVGRKSGLRRDTMLTSPVHDDTQVVIVASKGGAPGHPAWYVNLRDHPQVMITMQGVSRRMVARTASAAERAELWPAIVTAYKGYGDYQEKTDREIPVIILEAAT